MGHLLRKALTFKQLQEAFYKVKQNNGQAGADGVSIDEFCNNLNNNLVGLRELVIKKNYKSSPYQRIWIKKQNGKPRALAIPAVKDRILQTSVAQTLTPIFEEEFAECSYAYRRGRSVRMAVERITQLQRQGYKWVVEADIYLFFDQIPHDKLLVEARKLIRDDELLQLISHWIKVPVKEAGNLLPRTIGIPQGSPLSPLLSNLYLDQLDEAMIDQGHRLIRYADDFIVLAKNKSRAEAAIKLSKQLLQEIELKINPLKTGVTDFETGFKFLGWNFVRSLAVQGLPEKHTTNNTKIKDANETKQEKTQNKYTERNKISEFIETDLELDNSNDIDKEQTGILSIQRTIYITEQEAYLRTKNNRLIIEKKDEELLNLPAIKVDQVMLFGRQQFSNAFMQCCMRNDIPISLLSRTGKFYGRVESNSISSIKLTKMQFDFNRETNKNLMLAKQFILGKISNSLLILKRYRRNRFTLKADEVNNQLKILQDIKYRCKNANTLESLCGFEGAAATAYFKVWRLWMASDWDFGARQARLSLDPVNGLLDLAYTLLRQSVAGLIQARGVNPYLGHLHQLSSGHMALASDVMEEFRAVMADALVLNMLLNKTIEYDDFVLTDNRYTLKREPLKNFIKQFEKRMNKLIEHPVSKQKMDYRRIIDSQIKSLVEVYRNNNPTHYKACAFR